MDRRHASQTTAGSASDAKPSPAPASSTGTDRLGVLGVQLYTVRSLMEDDFVGTLRAVADVGYDAVEFAGYYDRSPSEVRDVLDELGLAAPAAHVPLHLLRGDLDAVIEAARVIGHTYVICPWLDEAERGSIEDYRALARFFNDVGGQIQDAGLRFGYHNHAFEFDPVDGQIPYDVLLAETDPERVTMEFDLYWTVEAGHDPLAYFEQHPGRFALCHVKDRTTGGDMVAVGEGAIDFASIFARSEQAGLRVYLVEHDNPDDPLASIRASYAYLEQLRF